MILFMKTLIICIFTFFLVACPSKSTDSGSTQVSDIDKKNEILREKQYTAPIAKVDSRFGKTLREAIYFSNSLEREALKLILKDRSLQRLTLFSVLSYIAETDSGAKKSTPSGLDCGKYEIQKQGKTLLVKKACYTPSLEVARIDEVAVDSEYRVEFLIREWASVVGLSVSLTGENVICSLKIQEKKLYRLTCENWSYLTNEDQTSSTVLKAKEFNFQRDSQKQFVIKGGFFKELVENKKIDITVPLEGKIKIFEKEIQVIDEFLDKKEVINAKKEELKKSKGEDISQDSSQGSSQDNSQEGQPENQGYQEQNQNINQEVDPSQQQPPPQVEPSTRGRRGR